MASFVTQYFFLFIIFHEFKGNMKRTGDNNRSYNMVGLGVSVCGS